MSHLVTLAILRTLETTEIATTSLTARENEIVIESATFEKGTDATTITIDNRRTETRGTETLGTCEILGIFENRIIVKETGITEIPVTETCVAPGTFVI